MKRSPRPDPLYANYSMFSRMPRGKLVIRACTSPVCQMAGSKDTLTTLRAHLGIDVGATTVDGVFNCENRGVASSFLTCSEE